MVLIPNMTCNHQQTTLLQVPALKTGYLDIKQHSKVRPRKLKAWRRRWAVLTQMSNLSSHEYVAKLDLYDNETKWQSNCSDKMTFVLERVTGVQQTKSTTHQFAFEVVERQPVLVMSGSTLEETYSWILTLQQIFTPEEILASKGDYKVTVSADQDSSRWNLSGDFTLSISPACLSLKDLEGRSVVTWALNTLKRFQVEKCPITGEKSVLLIESGPNSPTGQTCLRFHSDDSHNIMCAIKQSVSLAVALKEQTGGIAHPRSRKLGMTRDERNMAALLSNPTAWSPPVRNRSGSESSGSTVNRKSASVKQSMPIDLVPRLTSNLQAGEILHSKTGHGCDAHRKYKNGCMCQIFATNENSVLEHTIRSSESMKGRDEIKRTMAEQDPVSDNHALTCESPEIDFRRLRSVSSVVAAIKARYGQEPWRFESPNNDKTTDIDSAISSMISAPNDDLLWVDMQHCRDFDVKENQPSCMRDFLTHQGEHATQDACENEYEELGELDTAMRKMHQEQDPDVPPALPARPPSIGCTSCTAHTQISGVKTRSLFKLTENFHSNETNVKTRSHLANVNAEMCCVAPGHIICDVCAGETNVKTRSHLANVHAEMCCVAPGHVICDVCAGETNVKTRSHLANVHAEMCCVAPGHVICDVCAGETNVKTRSHLANVHAEMCCVAPGHVICDVCAGETNVKTRSHLANVHAEMCCVAPGHIICDVCAGEGSNRKSQCLPKSPSTEHLILNACSCANAANELLQDTACTRCYSSCASPEKTSYLFDKFTPGTVSKANNIQLHEKELRMTARSKPSVHNLTIRRETPERAGAEIAKPTLIPSAVNNNMADPVISFFLDNANFAVNPVVTGELTTVATSLSPNSEAFTPKSISASVLANPTLAMCNLKLESRPNSKSHHYDNGFGAFDCWGIGQMGNEETVTFSKISFADDQNHKGSDSTCLPPNVARYTQNNYIAMTDNSDSWRRKTTTSMNGMRGTATFPAGGLEKVACLGTQAQDTYVQPHDMPTLVKQCLQFRNVY